MPQRLDAAAADFPARFDALLAQKREVSEDVDSAARKIIDDVIARGDAALIDLSRKFDRIDLVERGIAISHEEIDAAVEWLAPRLTQDGEPRFRSIEKLG